MSDLFALYRFFDSSDALIYVGRTINPSRRFAKHASEKEWWPHVARVSIEQLGSLEELKRAERAAIEAEMPTHNIRMNGGQTSEPPSAVNVDGLLGRWFHSWEINDEGKKAVAWQGQILDCDGDDLIIQLYSWWDGAPLRQQLVRRADVYEWSLYESAEKMQIALGCRESIDGRECGNPATHKTSVGSYVCWKCAKFYGGGEPVA